MSLSARRLPYVRHALALLAAGVAAQGCSDARGGPGRTEEIQQGAARVAFRNTVSPPPPGWSGPVFRLSRDYPTASPGRCARAVCPWLYRRVDFSAPNPRWEGEWAAYMDDILDYVKAGQTLDPSGWNAAVDGRTRWYHVPWMAYDTIRGREFVHGMTNERTADLSDFLGGTLHAGLAADGLEREEIPLGLDELHRFARDTTKQFESWAVGFYNPWGGYALGRAIPRSGIPRAVRSGRGGWLVPGLPFPEGTVVAKILFTTATPEDVPFLRGSPRWIVDRHVQVGPDSFIANRRAPAPVYLAQMDVAVADRRSPTGWVYGTFAYNGTIESADVWERMSPVGLQWGSDPQAWPAVDSARARPVKESVIAPIDIYQHLGCNRRLDGPVDNPVSSCIACHQGAYAPAPVGTPGSYGKNIPPIFGYSTQCAASDSANWAYFQNLRYPEPYPPFPGVSGPMVPFDTSLQLQVAYLQYANWLQTVQAGGRRGM